MKKVLAIITTIVVVIIVILNVFYIWFASEMIHTDGPQQITTEYSKEYKTSFKKNFPLVQDIDIYYRQGKINFDFVVNPQMSLEECKQAVKKTKDILQDKNINESFLKGHGTQNSIQMRFDSEENSYFFSCPYYIPSTDISDNPNETISNDYKVWYMNINNQPDIQIEF